MATVKAIPEGCEGAIPHLVVKGAAKALEFYAKAFGAEEVFRMPSPDGRVMHAEFRIGSSLFYMADDFPEFCGGAASNPQALKGTPVTLHRFVTDVDKAVERAVKAGATVKMPVQDMFWGDRYGMVEDPFGHRWSLATHTKDMTPEEIGRAMAEAFSQGPPPG
ncbi:MAG: VOC family protein [Planctomycetes bacterium]|nr:VOC family protein [Planctomycetota bacterium]